MANSVHCRYYSYQPGGIGATCAKGVDIYQRAGERHGCMLRMPCVDLGERRKGETPFYCVNLSRYTLEEVIAFDEELEEYFFSVFPFLADIKKSSQPGDRGERECPKECGGLVTWMRAKTNGHLHAQCSTVGCISIME